MKVRKKKNQMLQCIYLIHSMFNGLYLIISQWYEKALLETPNLASIYAPNGKLLGEGDLLKRTNFSKTLELIAENGSEVFYRVIMIHGFT